MSRVPQNIYDTISFLPHGSRRQTSGKGGRVGSMRTPANKGEVSKIGKSYGHLMWMASYSKISIT